jgi:hypothetical protein
MKNKVKLRKRFIFLALGICLSIACNNAAPPVQVSTQQQPPASQAGQPGAAAGGHDESAHELENKMPRIRAEELKRLVAAGQAVIVDVRSAADYAQAHIQGAINLPVQQIETGQYPKLPRDKRLIGYCT